MDILIQIFFGTYAGWMVYRQSDSMFFTIVLGILGAMASSLLMQSFGLQGVYGYNSYSFFLGITGAVTAVHCGRLLQRLPSAKDLTLHKPLPAV